MSMQSGGASVAILGISFDCAMIVEKIIGVMRVPIRCVLMGMHLGHRNSGRNNRRQQQGENAFTHQV